MRTTIYILLSVLIVSLISLIGIFFLSVRPERLKKILIYMVSFAAGGLIADVFIHILPEIFEANSYSLSTAVYILLGIIFSFIVEKFIHWRHCHLPQTHDHMHPFAAMSLLGDSIHNFIDGLVIGASYLIGLPAGLATTLAVIFHEIPQEIGDFGVLMHGGISKKRAMILNFLTALTSFGGAILAIVIGKYTGNIHSFVLPFAAGTFIYIANTDLIPELHKEVAPLRSFGQLFFFCCGIAIVASMLLVE